MLVVDLETTSLNVFDAELVTGFFCLLDEDYNVVDTKLIQCNPWRWSDEAEAVHGITKKQASTYNKFTEVYEGLINWIQLSGAKEIWCHSNVKMYGKIVPYDYAILRLQMFNMGDTPFWIMNGLTPYSTHSLAKVLQDRFTFDGFSLDNICKELSIPLKHHDAKSDCLATAEIIKRLLPMTTREEIYNYERGINENPDGLVKRNSRRFQKNNGSFG